MAQILWPIGTHIWTVITVWIAAWWVGNWITPLVRDGFPYLNLCVTVMKSWQFLIQGREYPKVGFETVYQRTDGEKFIYLCPGASQLSRSFFFLLSSSKATPWQSIAVFWHVILRLQVAKANKVNLQWSDMVIMILSSRMYIYIYIYATPPPGTYLFRMF